MDEKPMSAGDAHKILTQAMEAGLKNGLFANFAGVLTVVRSLNVLEGAAKVHDRQIPVDKHQGNGKRLQGANEPSPGHTEQ
jgi:hypothetical protein